MKFEEHKIMLTAILNHIAEQADSAFAAKNLESNPIQKAMLAGKHKSLHTLYLHIKGKYPTHVCDEKLMTYPSKNND